jgi:hypothetical protein
MHRVVTDLQSRQDGRDFIDDMVIATGSLA